MYVRIGGFKLLVFVSFAREEVVVCYYLKIYYICGTNLFLVEIRGVGFKLIKMKLVYSIIGFLHLLLLSLYFIAITGCGIEDDLQTSGFIQLEIDGKEYEGFENTQGYTTLNYTCSSVTLGVKLKDVDYFGFYVYENIDGDKVTYFIENNELSEYNIETDVITRIKL